MDYKRPGKEKRNEDFLRRIGMNLQANPYTEEKLIPKKLFLIICEGQNTEPKYFEGFPVPTKTILIEGGPGF